MKQITQEELKHLLKYDATTGEFNWNAAVGGIMKGRIAGTAHCRGYRQIRIKGDYYLAHRLAWLYEKGELPCGQVDHINHDRADNRIKNLRIVSSTENQRNRKMGRNNTSGSLGVTWHKKGEKWGARIGILGRTKYLGFFEKKEAAIAARKKAEVEYGFHENHGKFLTNNN